MSKEHILRSVIFVSEVSVPGQSGNMKRASVGMCKIEEVEAGVMLRHEKQDTFVPWSNIACIVYA